MKNRLYELIIGDLTDRCYKNCLGYFPPYSTILDVGIGNGAMIKKYHSLIKSKGLKITGIDICKRYLNCCRRLIRTYDLEDHMDIHHEAVELYEPPEKTYFDFILFSMSFMLFTDGGHVLDRVKDWLKQGGEILFFQTMYKRRNPLLNFIKPRLKYFTMIEFGDPIYENDFFALLRKKNLPVLEDRFINNGLLKGEYRLIITTGGNEEKTTWRDQGHVARDTLVKHEDR